MLTPTWRPFVYSGLTPADTPAENERRTKCSCLRQHGGAWRLAAAASHPVTPIAPLALSSVLGYPDLPHFISRSAALHRRLNSRKSGGNEQTVRFVYEDEKQFLIKAAMLREWIFELDEYVGVGLGLQTLVAPSHREGLEHCPPPRLFSTYVHLPIPLLLRIFFSLSFSFKKNHILTKKLGLKLVLINLVCVCFKWK